MRVTDTVINFELINVEAQNNCVFSCSGNKSFGNLNLLNVQTKRQNTFMNFELNQAILNGSLVDFAVNEQTNIAFFSQTVSDENCMFDNIWVQGELTQRYNFVGITLDFGESYLKKVTVEYYQDNLRVLHKTIDEIDNSWVYCDMHGKEINKIKVIFDESWAPFQYANLQEFIFGNVIEWTSDDVISLNLQEETDIISKVMPSDTLTLTIYSKDDDFNVLNPRSSYAYLLPNQKFSIREYIYEIDDETNEVAFQREIDIGKFYLDTWESLHNKQIKFNLISPLAHLDKTKFKKSRMYVGQNSDNAYSVLEDIFSDAQWDEYSIDESLRDIYLSGYIPVCTHKQAIHQIAFVCNCVVYDNRSNTIVVKPFDSSSIQNIENHEIFDTINVKRKESVTSLSVTVHNFVLKSSREEVFKGHLEKGIREIILNSPCSSIQSSDVRAVITEQGANYVILDISETDEYTLTGLKYEDNSYKYTKEVIDDISVKKNNLDIEKATLINPNNVETLAEKWISYFRMYNLSIEFKFLSNGQITGQNISFTDENGNVFTGALVRQNLDLSKGFLSSCYIIGYQQLKESEPNPLFAGDDEIEKSKVELYSNEEYGII